MKSVLERLTEGVVKRDLRKETKALVAKWDATGLLDGIESERARDNMAVLMENQAKELLREASVMSSGDVEGFAAVSFPLVRRVFGNLIANEVVSVQPMALPTGLIFFLDFQYTGTRLGKTANDSVYGGGVVGRQLTGGVSLTGANVESGFYNLENGYSSPTGSVSAVFTGVASGGVGAVLAELAGLKGTAAYTALGDGGLMRFDADMPSGTLYSVSTTPIAGLTQLNLRNLIGVVPQTVTFGRVQRRLTRIDPTNSANLMLVIAATGSETTPQLSGALAAAITTTFPIDDNRTAGTGLGSIVGTTTWGLENDANIPEIDIKVDSIDIRADTKKLKAKWTPELQQDLSAYQNVDAEVELTQILSEHVTWEINQELLEDLVKHATAGTYYWSRRIGRFVTPTTGADISTSANESLLGGDFTGTLSDWYETLIFTINDVSAQIQRKTLRGGANFLVIGPETANILEATAGFRATVSHDEEGGEVGVVKIGTIRKKWDIYVDSYFPRNLVLVGRKGSSFLESGYVFAPYVPLQVTPTILGPEDFVPRKAVWTRYGKKMVRPDFYGLVVIKDFNG